MAGPRALRFAVRAPLPEPPADPAAAPTRVSLAGYEDDAELGEPALPRRVVLVAVPPSGAVRVRGVGLEPEVLGGPAYRPEAGDATAERDAGAAARAGTRARLLDVSWMRNQRVARISISPADYDRSTGRVTLHRLTEVEVECDGAATGGARFEDPDPFEGVYRDVLVNYEQGLAWRRTAPAARGAGALGVPADSSVLVDREWVKIAVPVSGMYQVTYSQIRDFTPFQHGDAVSLDQLRLFTLPGYPLLAEESFCDTCDLEEVAISFKDDGNGLFDVNEDAFVFYGMGSSDWANAFDRTRPDTSFLNHPYDTRSYYYLTVSRDPRPVPGTPRRIPLQAGNVALSGSEIADTTFRARAHFESDSPSEYWPHSTTMNTTLFWEKWFWRSINLGGTFAVTANLPGIDSTQVARLRVRLFGVAATCPLCSCPPTLGTIAHQVDVSWNSTSLGRHRWGRTSFRIGNEPYTIDRTITDLKTRDNRLVVTIPPVPECPERIDQVATAWFDVFYERRFTPVGNVLRFESRPAAGDYLYRIGPFTTATPPRIFDVSDPMTPVEVTGASYDTILAGGYRLSFEASQAGFRRYHALTPDSIVRVHSSNLTEPQASSTLQDLRTAPAADYVVIHYDGFQTAADSLIAWRAWRQGLQVLAVPISALYDQFSGGRTDPSAIRNFMRSAYQNWSRRPTYVTLLGDASFDYKNYMGRATGGQPGTLVPTFENLFDASPQVNRQYATDDWMLNVVNLPGDFGIVPDFFGSRLAATDATAAMTMVQKVLRYERVAPFGEYRNRVMLIADDHEQGAIDDGLHWEHLAQTARLDSFWTPLHLDRVYIYLHKYPDGAGETKPEAKNQIISTLNGEGVTLFNYVGHGSPFQMADERVFLDTDVGSLNNPEQLPLFVAASCDVGKYDDPREISLGERLMLRGNGGAIGVISATELAFSGQNSTLNQAIFRFLFERDGEGRYHVPVSEALLRAKLPGSQNSQKYQLLGDAVTRLNLPEYWVVAAIYDSAGRDTVAEIRQGKTYMVRGEVRDGVGGAAVALDGVASVLIEDPRPVEQPPDCELSPGCSRPLYQYQAAPLFRGELGVAGGDFQGRFVAPFECRLGDSARVRAYVNGRVNGVGAGFDGVGARFVTLAAGTPGGADREGPAITLGFDGGATVVRGDAVLRIGLQDPSGILITGYSPQNGIIVTVDGSSTSRVDVSPSFRYVADSYQAGTATFPLPGLAPGPHRISVSAADNLAAGLTAAEHRSTATIEFEVQDEPPLRIVNSYLFPNPTRSGAGGGGQFVIDAPGDSVNALLRIYTVSGRLIRELESFGSIGQIQIPWDGLDAEGENLANGLYLFKVHVNAREEDGESSARLKASAEGRFIIVGR